MSIITSPFGIVGPGATGGEVEAIQRLIAADITGVYDEATEQRVRGLQTVHRLPLCDGVFDRELEAALTRSASPGRSE